MRQEITTTETASIMGITDDVVRRLCRNGFLSARMVGNSWWISLKAAKSLPRPTEGTGSEAIVQASPTQEFHRMRWSNDKGPTDGRGKFASKDRTRPPGCYDEGNKGQQGTGEYEGGEELGPIKIGKYCQTARAEITAIIRGETVIEK